jgi:hypothetical protein
MAIFGPFYNAKVVINAVDLSDHVASVALDVSIADVDTTAMSSTGAKTRTGGLTDGKLDIVFRQDFNSSKVDATLWTAYTGKVPVTFQVNPTNAANSATNPAYTGSVLVTDYHPLSGQVGANLDVTVSWPVSGATSRATS